LRGTIASFEAIAHANVNAALDLCLHLWSKTDQIFLEFVPQQTNPQELAVFADMQFNQLIDRLLRRVVEIVEALRDQEVLVIQTLFDEGSLVVVDPRQDRRSCQRQS
jgi:hypothetical protein